MIRELLCLGAMLIAGVEIGVLLMMRVETW